MSDTHSHLDPKVFHHFQDVDEIWHAGDFGNPQLVEKLHQFKPLRGVYGNIDGTPIRANFPEDLLFDIDGFRVFMTHIGGYPGRYKSRVKKLLIEHKPNLYICGHSHILKIMPDKTLNLLHINPGACGNSGYHQIKTLVRFEIKEQKIQNLEVIEIGRRGKLRT